MPLSLLYLNKLQRFPLNSHSQWTLFHTVWIWPEPVNHWLEQVIIHQVYPLSLRNMAVSPFWTIPISPEKNTSDSSVCTLSSLERTDKQSKLQTGSKHLFLCTRVNLKARGYESHFSDCQQTHTDRRSVLNVDTCKMVSKREKKHSLSPCNDHQLLTSRCLWDNCYKYRRFVFMTSSIRVINLKFGSIMFFN